MEFALIIVFIVGYMAIALEHNLKINKTAPALLTGVITWVIYIVSQSDVELVNEHLLEHLGEISSILFFLMGAMTIVEVIDSYNGFEIITERITQNSQRSLIWIIGFLAFFLSAILDNLTTTIVMVSLLRKLIDDKELRLTYVGLVVIAANAGGAWSPIGDVTTTMLWIGGQISAGNIVAKLIVPSLLALIIPLLILSKRLKGTVQRPVTSTAHYVALSRNQQLIVLVFGVLMLIMVPVFKTLTHLPPFMGMMLGLGLLWILIELMHQYHERRQREFGGKTIIQVMRRIDLASILFFLGILLAVSALQISDILPRLARLMDEKIANIDIIVISIGLLSSIVDNVPMVAAAQGMYGIIDYPMNDYIWEFLAYCAGTGGSILIIGSAAGVAAMGMEKINFFWHVKKIGWIALIGYLAGAFWYIFQETTIHSLF